MFVSKQCQANKFMDLKCFKALGRWLCWENVCFPHKHQDQIGRPTSSKLREKPCLKKKIG